MSEYTEDQIRQNAGEIWAKLSRINPGDDKLDVKEVQGKKFTYLSWAWAWGVLMEHYPDADFRIVEEYAYENSDVTSGNKREGYVTRTGRTMMVGVEMDIRGVQRAMWLPVMDNKNLAMVNPDARSISDARMRCLVKCLALYGLCHYIYAGEDLPQGEDTSKGAKKKEEEPTGTGEVNEHARTTREVMSVFLTECNDVSSLEQFWLKNKDALAKVKNECKPVFDELVSMFKDAKAKLTPSK